LIVLDVPVQGRESSSLLAAVMSDVRFSDIPVIAMTAIGSMPGEKSLYRRRM
jgi:hypothetical protein